MKVYIFLFATVLQATFETSEVRHTPYYSSL